MSYFVSRLSVMLTIIMISKSAVSSSQVTFNCFVVNYAVQHRLVRIAPFLTHSRSQSDGRRIAIIGH